MPLLQNLRFAARTLRRNPAVAASAILAIGLGVGATSAMFSATDGILLHPLPFPRSEQLVTLWESMPQRNIPKIIVAPGNFYDWRAQSQSYSAVGAYVPAVLNLAVAEGEPERFTGAVADAGFFAALGVPPLLGRTFTQGETQPGSDGVLILSYPVWQQRFGGDRAILGRTLDLNNRQRTVIGIMPPGFEFPAQATMWAPLALDAEARARRDLHQFRAIARLKEGVTLQAADRELSALHTRLAKAYPDLNADESAHAAGMLADIVGPVRPALLVLMGAVAAVLLIACANVANLLLARASRRRREIAIRSGLGASRSSIAAQMLTESTLLGLLGGAAGLLLAWAALQGLLALAPANTPRLDQVGLNWRVVGLALALSLSTGLLFGLAPAWYATRIDVNGMLKEGGRSGVGRSPLRSALVTAQVAVALILLAGAGLLMRSFYEVVRVDAGFNPDGVMTMKLAPARAKFGGHPEMQIQLARAIRQKVAALPGVRYAGIGTDLPLTGNPKFIMRFEGFPPVTPSQAPIADYFAVTPGYFEALGMRVVRGRAINETDRQGTPLVAVVNQRLIDRYFPGQDPIGRRLEIGFDTPPEWRQIVGVVADVHSAGLDQDAPVQVFGAYSQIPTVFGAVPSAISVLARSAQDPASLSAAMHAAIFEVDRSQPVYDMTPMSEIVGKSIAQRRLALVLLAFFGASALALAAIGAYGVMSFVVAQRTGEIGIRMALGAGAWQVAWLVQRQGMALVAAGVVLGTAGAALLTRLMGALLFHVDHRDPLVFAGAAAVLVIVSAMACWLPARRAASVDPLEALRTS